MPVPRLTSLRAGIGNHVPLLAALYESWTFPLRFCSRHAGTVFSVRFWPHGSAGSRMASISR